MARPRTPEHAALGRVSLAMASLGLWVADLATSHRAASRTSLREWFEANKQAPSGLCLAAGITWFATMAIPAVSAIFFFAALAGAGADLRWWGWLPPLFLTAAVAGFTINGIRDLINTDAIPTLAADLLIGALILASTLTVFALQQMALT